MTPPHTSNKNKLYYDGLVPLIIGVTGHRDLAPEEIPKIRSFVESFFRQLQARFPDRPLQILSALAEGADRLVAGVALDLGLSLAVPLPMPRDLYSTDFATDESRAEFERLCARAQAIYELPISSGFTAEQMALPGTQRDAQYAQLGVFLCAHSHMLLALWDGKHSDEIGGTAQVVKFHQDDVLANDTRSASTMKQLLVDDESDLVYHIVVSRDRPDGAPLDGLEALSCGWLTSDESEARILDLPEKYAKIFERTSAFNREARRHYERMDSESSSLIADQADVGLPVETQQINEFFRAADWLAVYFQRRLLNALRITYGFAFLMGLMFILYADLEARPPFMLLFAVCFSLALGAHGVAARFDWHSKYLEYRALAEGLRVQFYWAAAGVTSETMTKYSHDNFRQKQDFDLGWIRNVMRVAGIGCDVAPNTDSRGLAFAMREWIGNDDSGGQLKYYRTKTTRYVRRSQRLDLLSKLAGGVVVSALAFSVISASEIIREILLASIGTILLAVSVRHAYAFRIAENELIKQYGFMYSIFSNARRRMETVSTDKERRRILRGLGETALDEHAEWLFLRRDRPPDVSGLWRLES